MATTHRVSIGVIIALLALYAVMALRTGVPLRKAPLASPMASRPAGAPEAPGAVDWVLEKLLAGDYEAQIEAYPVLNGGETPPAQLSIVVRHDPGLHLEAQGLAATGDEETPLVIEALAANGRLSYTTSWLGEWLADDYEDPRQVYSLFGLIDDLGLLAEVLAAGTPGQPAPSPDRRLIILPDERLVQRLLAAQEEVIADRAQAVYSVTEAAGGTVEVLSRLVYEVGENRYEVNRITRISPSKGRIS